MNKPSAIERIKDAALRLVVERGVGATTIRDLAQMAGVAEGALYRHYATKEDLIRELFRERYAAYARRLELVQAKERGLRAKLRAIVARYLPPVRRRPSDLPLPAARPA